MRRLVALVALAVPLVLPVAPAIAGYDRECGGIVDTECHGWVCSLDCFHRECLVWLNPLHDAQSAQCVSPIPLTR